MEPISPDVGARIRAIRKQRNLSLRALAERCDLSINAISLIERGENSPTVSSLHILAMALGVKITSFFEETQAQAVVFVKHDQRLHTRSNDLMMESLGSGLHNQQLEPFLVTVQANTGDASEAVVHPGQEFVFCLEGEIQYRIGEHIYRLTPGDSLLFDGTQLHCCFNAGANPAKIFLVFQTDEGDHLAQQRHLDG